MAVRNLSTQFLDIWAKLTTLQKVAIGAASGCCTVTSAVLLSLILGRVLLTFHQYPQVLFSRAVLNPYIPQLVLIIDIKD